MIIQIYFGNCAVLQYTLHFRERLLIERNLSFSANAVRQVIVDKSCRLQVGVTNRAAEEFESPFFHVLAHGIGLGRGYRNLAQRPEGVGNRLPVGKERQGVVVETAELFLYGEE